MLQLLLALFLYRFLGVLNYQHALRSQIFEGLLNFSVWHYEAANCSLLQPSEPILRTVAWIVISLFAFCCSTRTKWYEHQ